MGGTPRISQSFCKGNNATNATKPKVTKLMKAWNTGHKPLWKNIENFHMNWDLQAVQSYKF